MNPEIEVKFLNIDHAEIRSKLQEIGAICETPLVLMKRAIIDYPDRRLQAGSPNSYIRVRDEGNKISLTYKQFDSISIDGAKEVELTVSSFEDAIKIFTSVGLEVVSFQESKRETWRLNDCEIVLDEWPWLKPYIEIEADSEAIIKEVSAKLELDWADAMFGDVMVAYRAQYPYLNPEQTIGRIAEVRFNAPFPELLKA
jgi:adenylate cyclase class 2